VVLKAAGLVKGHAVNAVAPAGVYFVGYLVGFADDGKGVEHFVVNECPHFCPLAAFGHGVEFALQIAPSVHFEYWPISRGGGVESDLSANASGGFVHFFFVSAGDDEPGARYFEVVEAAAGGIKAAL